MAFRSESVKTHFASISFDGRAKIMMGAFFSPVRSLFLLNLLRTIHSSGRCLPIFHNLMPFMDQQWPLMSFPVLYLRSLDFARFALKLNPF
jgi:hypothetical protein